MLPIKNLLLQGIQDGIFPGGAVSVGDGGGETYRTYAGHRALHPEPLPLLADTLFDMASLTKIMATTMVTLKLFELNKLTPTDLLGHFFDTPRDKEKITLHDILTHSSGLRSHALLSSADVTAEILHIPLSYERGKGVEYSCLGFILLGKICEIVTGKTLAQSASEYIFVPLNMMATGYQPAQANNTFAATEYDNTADKWLCGTVHDENARFMGGISGNAGLFSDITDCGKFAQMLINRGKGIISKELFNEAVKNHTPFSDTARGWGFALDLCTPGGWGHTGFTGTSIWVNAASTLYGVLLTNRVHPTRANGGIIDFRKRFYTMLG
jgi:CubicO group peptidase (beta-lactamase class C family)